MGKDNKIVKGLREAVAHAKGEDNECRVSVVHVPNPTVSPVPRPDVEGIEQNLTIVRREALRFPDEPLGLYQAIQIIERTLALIAYIGRLEEVVRDAIKMCPGCDGTGKAHTMGDETEVGCSPGSSAVPCPVCMDWHKALAALGDGDG